MSDISIRRREEVVQRANGRCEYCQLSQLGQEATFHVDHIVPRSAGGESEVDNLALSCVSCSLRKSAKQFVVDPESEEKVAIFNPRTQRWTDHFVWVGETVVAKTAIGRATISALAMNRPLIISIRREEAELGRHPPV